MKFVLHLFAFHGLRGPPEYDQETGKGPRRASFILEQKYKARGQSSKLQIGAKSTLPEQNVPQETILTPEDETASHPLQRQSISADIFSYHNIESNLKVLRRPHSITLTHFRANPIYLALYTIEPRSSYHSPSLPSRTPRDVFLSSSFRTPRAVSFCGLLSVLFHCSPHCSPKLVDKFVTRWRDESTRERGIDREA